MRKLVPIKKTMLDIASAFLVNGERAANLMAKMMIWKSPQTKQNCSAAK